MKIKSKYHWKRVSAILSVTLAVSVLQAGCNFGGKDLTQNTNQVTSQLDQNRLIASGTTVNGLTLINADSNLPQPLDGISGHSSHLGDNAKFNLQKTGLALNIRANVSGAGRVLFDYDSGAISHLENVAPFAFASDLAGDYFSWTPDVGTHVLVVTAFAKSDTAGTAGVSRTFHFSVSDGTSAPTPTPVPVGTPTPTPAPTSTPVVVNTPTPTPVPTSTGPSISSATLINSDSNTEQALDGIPGHSVVITEGSTFDLSKTGSALNIRADANSAGSVSFNLDNGSISHIENVQPYAMASDSGGIYNAWTPVLGNHTLTMTAFSGPDASGSAGPSLTLHFTVTKSTAATPTPTATPVPTATPSSGTGPGASTAEPSNYSAPIVITKGGTYSGNWQSLNMDVPAVSVATSEPVIIQNCHISHNSNAIETTGANAHLTIRNCSFHGKAPNQPKRHRGGAVVATYFANLDVENNYFENTSTVVQAYFYQGNATAQETVTVKYNLVRNIIGTFSDGVGEDWENFVAIQNFVQPQGNPRFGEIAWNNVLNAPFKSACEDLINFYRAGGRSDSWFKVHDNYLSGAFHTNPHDDNGSAGGIQIDGPDNTTSAYIEVYGNSISQILNGGMGAAAGSHVYMHNNRVVSSSKEYVTDPVNGSWTTGSYAGLWIFESDPNHVGTMSDIRIEDNLVGWANPDYTSPYHNRLDFWTNLGGGIKNNTPWPDTPITKATEEAEYQLFIQKAQTNGVKIGPQ